MIVRQVYVYAFYDRASHSYAGTCSFAEKLHWIALSYIRTDCFKAQMRNRPSHSIVSFVHISL